MAPPLCGRPERIGVGDGDVIVPADGNCCSQRQRQIRTEHSMSTAHKFSPVSLAENLSNRLKAIAGLKVSGKPLLLSFFQAQPKYLS